MNYETIDADAKSSLAREVEQQKETIAALPELPSEEQMDAYITRLTDLEAYCDARNIYITGNTDYNLSEMPTSTTSQAGHSAVVVAMQVQAAKQAMTEAPQVATPTAGMAHQEYTAKQKIAYLPNGTYRLKCMARTTEGR